LGKNTKVAYFDQHRANLDDAGSIFENIAADNSRIVIAGEALDVRSYLERFMFDTYKQRQPVGSLSGGERARVALAKILSRGANLVILDEPTNDLDVATLGALEELLIGFDGCAIAVTHDRYFLNRIATSVLAFLGDGSVVRYAGNYDDFRTQRAHSLQRLQEAPRDAPVRSSPQEKPGAKEREKPKGLTYAERIELDGLMDRIAEAEHSVAKVEGQLADPALYATRGTAVARLRADLDRAKREVATLLSRWEELEMRRAMSKG
jgi:ATP-binding cassette subfamily F protein uup